MTQRIKHRVVAGLFAVALALPAAAQAEGPGIGGTPDLDRARALKAQAESLYDQPKAWRKVARLLEESAALRTAEDAEAYDCLVYAGRIRASLGDSKDAKRLLEKAAEHALARGSVLDAAQAYVDAAFAAQASGDAGDVAEFAQRVKLLASSPLISETDRAQLLSRVG